MGDKSQIEAAARNLMHRFGEDALRQADIRITELEEHGEMDGLEFWRGVRGMVRSLLHASGTSKH